MSVLSPYQRAVLYLFDPRKVFPFLVASLSLGILANVSLDLLKKSFGEEPETLWTIFLSSIVILAVMVVFIRLIFERERSQELNLDTHSQPVPSRGLVFLVSKKESVMQAFEFHQKSVQRLWLLHSKQTATMSEELKQQMLSRKPTLVIETFQIEDIYDPKPYFEKVRSIYRTLPDDFTESDVTCDFTGMTASASVGMSLACVKYNLPLEYTPAKFVDDKPVSSLPPISVILPVRNKTLPSGGSS